MSHVFVFRYCVIVTGKAKANELRISQHRLGIGGKIHYCQGRPGAKTRGGGLHPILSPTKLTVQQNSFLSVLLPACLFAFLTWLVLSSHFLSFPPFPLYFFCLRFTVLRHLQSDAREVSADLWYRTGKSRDSISAFSVSLCSAPPYLDSYPTSQILWLVPQTLWLAAQIPD